MARVDGIITLASQSVGPLHCQGTEDGVAVLYKAGRGVFVVWSGDGSLVALFDLSC